MNLMNKVKETLDWQKKYFKKFNKDFPVLDYFGEDPVEEMKKCIDENKPFDFGKTGY